VHTRNDEALQLASIRGHLEVVQYLVENGATQLNAANRKKMQKILKKPYVPIAVYLRKVGLC
jgi:hypothetical protein